MYIKLVLLMKATEWMVIILQYASSHIVQSHIVNFKYIEVIGLLDIVEARFLM